MSDVVRCDGGWVMREVYGSETIETLADDGKGNWVGRALRDFTLPRGANPENWDDGNEVQRGWYIISDQANTRVAMRPDDDADIASNLADIGGSTAPKLSYDGDLGLIMT